MKYEFNGLFFGQPEFLENPNYIVLPDFPVPVFSEVGNTLVFLRDYLAISKAFYELPEISTQADFEQFCSSPRGQATLVADMLSLATEVATLPEAKQKARQFLR